MVLTSKKSFSRGENYMWDATKKSTMTSDTPIRSIERAFDILEIMMDSPRQGVSEIAKQTGLPKSTVHSHLSTLRSLGFVQKEGSEYSATTKLLTLAGKQRKTSELYQKARWVVDELANETDGYADLYIEEEGIGVLLHLATGGTNVELGFAYEGLRQPLHTNASGKSILAFTPEERTSEILDLYRSDQFDDSIDEESLFETLQRAREDKCIIDEEEAMVGMSGVGAPILNREGNAVAGISVYKPRHGMSDSFLEKELPKLVRQKANIIEVNLNYS